MKLFRDWEYAIAGHIVRDAPCIVEIGCHDSLSIRDFLVGTHLGLVSVNPVREIFHGEMGHNSRVGWLWSSNRPYHEIDFLTHLELDQCALVLTEFKALYPLSPVFELAKRAKMVVICYDPVYDEEICAVKRESGKNWMVGGAGRTTVAVGR